jgi:transcription elongation factor Elf1
MARRRLLINRHQSQKRQPGPANLFSCICCNTISSVRLKIEQNQLVIAGRCTCSGGIGLQGA